MKQLYTLSDLGVTEHLETADCCQHSTYGVRGSPTSADVCVRRFDMALHT
jgi:hypothetical protein